MARYSFENARRSMIDGQLRPNKVNKGPLLERFKTVPREEFADTSHQKQAYVDCLLPIAENRYMFAPMTVARMLQALDLKRNDTVLVVAGGTGYTASLIAPLVKSVHLVEENGYLLDVAKRQAADLSLNNISYLQAAPEEGDKKEAPYDAIILDAAAEEVPMQLFEQLKINGQLVAVVAQGVTHEATLFRKTGKMLLATPLFETKGKPLENFKKREQFVF